MHCASARDISASDPADRPLAERSRKGLHLRLGVPETPFTPTYQALQTDPAWIVRSVPTRHDIIRWAPQDFAAILLGLQAAADVVGRVGIEPTTNGLKVQCSTD